MFITFEGGEGSGKTTQARLLSEWLGKKGYEVLLTREPGGVPLAESLRALLMDAKREAMDPWAELFLFAACRSQNRAERLAPALARGAIVVCDRYSDATIAYQGYGRGLPLRAVKGICRWAEQGVRPDLTLLIDLPVQVGLARMKARRHRATRFDEAPAAFHERVRKGYLALSRQEPERFVVIDGARSIATVARNVDRAVTLQLAGRR